MNLEGNWLEKLFDMQNELDSFIECNIDYSATVEENINAFLVELGEFLNEVKAFKYWSTKSMDKGKAYEEFVDGLHFLLSLGNKMWEDNDFTNLYNKLNRLNDLNNNNELELDFDLKDNKIFFVNHSNTLFNKSSALNSTLEDYEDYFYSFVRLGFFIGMDLTNLISEYQKKNRINYQRQVDGY